jgi:hypothetical protein
MPPWDNEPIRRADLDERLAIFQAPDAAELALFDSPSGRRRAADATRTTSRRSGH